MTRFQKRGYTNNSSGGGVLDLTDIKPSSNNTIDYNNNSTAKIFCEFCDVPLIKKMDDIKLLGTQDAGTAVNTRFICPRCGNIKDPLKVADFDKLKRGERGQTIRSLSSSEGTPFVEMFNSSNTTDNKELKGTQVSKALQRYNDPEPNEEENMRAEGYKMLRTEVSFADGRKIVKTYD